MKKNFYVFLCAAVLFVGSCADLSMNEEEALKASLPDDFDWNEYAEINRDVAMSQIILDLREKGRDADSVRNCINLLKNEDFAKKVYLEYVGCPERGWLQSEKCEGGVYANNSNYSKPKTKYNTETEKLDTISWECVIGNCWRGGWDEISEKEAACTGNEEEDWDAGRTWCDGKTIPLKDTLQKSLTMYLETSNTNLGVIKTMCLFMPKAEELINAENYLKNFPFDSTLLEQHYHFFGRYDGRPYKYCEQGHIGEEKTQKLAEEDKRKGTYYDYGKYTFCLKKDDQKIYVIK
jgi:hypothetical protein